MATKALTRDLIKRLSTALTKTPLVEVALGSIALPKSTFYYWKSLAQDIADGNPERENLTPNDQLLLEFLDAIETSRAKVGQKLSDAVLKGAMQDPRVAIDMHTGSVVMTSWATSLMRMTSCGRSGSLKKRL